MEMNKHPISKMQLVRLKSLIKHAAREQDLMEFLKGIYFQGFADGANAEVVKSDERWLKLKKHCRYVIICGNCGCELEIDVDDLIKQNAQEEIERKWSE